MRNFKANGIPKSKLLNIIKMTLRPFRQRLLMRRAVLRWRAFAVKRRPRILTEEEETQIKTFKKWKIKVFSCINANDSYIFTRLRPQEPYRELKV